MPSRRSSSLLAVAAAGLLLGAPAGAGAHGEDIETVQEHMELDSVSLTPEQEERLEQRTETATAADAEAASGAVTGGPAQVGRWGGVVDWPVVAIHAALLSNGKVLAYDSNGDVPNEDQTFTRATVWDPGTGAQTSVDVATGVNIFCSGLAHLPDGSIYVAGGNENLADVGIRATHVFRSETNSWTREGEMKTKRWYPSVTPLRNGEMLITEGDPYSHVPEIRGTDGTLRELPGVDEILPLYPWTDVAPDGRAFLSGPDWQMMSIDTSGAGSLEKFETRDDEYRSYGSHAMYDIGKILVAGGGDAPVSKTAIDIDLNGPEPIATPTASMALPRRHHNLTVLADGTVLATGGFNSNEPSIDLANGVYDAELWDPETGRWQTLAAEAVTRQYHSVALLLPDGRVLSAGGGICGVCNAAGYLAKNAEIFSPPYLFEQGTGELAPRPTIDSVPAAVGYGDRLPIATPNAASIGKVAMVRLGAVTHSVNMEQRYVPLNYSAGSEQVVATSPPNPNIAPPGVYMLFVINDEGVPSVSKMVRVDPTVPSPPPPKLTRTRPGSPAADVTPIVRGTSLVGTTVEIYSAANCGGDPLVARPASRLVSPGIQARVRRNATTKLRAVAIDAAGNSSRCSKALRYVEDSDPARTRIGKKPARSGTARLARFRFSSSERGSRFKCKLDRRSVPCKARASFRVSPGKHSIAVTAVDSAGNRDRSPAAYRWTVKRG